MSILVCEPFELLINPRCSKQLRKGRPRMWAFLSCAWIGLACFDFFAGWTLFSSFVSRPGRVSIWFPSTRIVWWKRKIRASRYRRLWVALLFCI